MANLYLSSGDNLTGLNFGGNVFGAAGSESVTYAAGTTGIIVDQNVEQVKLAEATSAYTFQQSGNQLLVFSGATQVARITLQNDTNGTLISFANGTVEAKVSAAGMTLGGTTVPSAAPSQVVPTTIDGSGATAPTVVTLGSTIQTLTGTSANETFRGVINDDGTTNASTIQTGDIVDGGAGTDRLEITVASDQGTAPLLETVSVEQIYIRQLDGGANNIDASLFAGVQQLVSNRSLSTLTVDNVANQVVIGAVSTKADFNVNYAANALGGNKTQAITLDGVGTAAARPEIEVTTSGTDAITGLSFDVTGANVITYEDDDDVATSLTVTGTGSLDLDADAEIDNVTTADFSKNSGGVTVTLSNEDVVVTGGSGADKITIDNGTVLSNKAAINLGAGNDSLLDGGSAGVGTTAVLDGGAGTDTITSTLLEVGNAANIKNFEVLDLAGETRSIDASLFSASNFQSLAVNGALGGAVTVTKLAGSSINVDIAATTGSALTATLASSTATTNAVNLNFTSLAGATLTSFASTGIETVNIASNSLTGGTNTVGTLSLADNSLSKIVITGSDDLIISDIDTNASAATATANVQSALTTIDGSAATGDLTIVAGESDAIGASGFATIYRGLSVSTGTGDDQVTMGAAGSVNVGTGTDFVAVNAAGVSVTFGTDDNIDVVDINAGAAFTSSGGVFGASSPVTTITGFKAGDQIDVTTILVGDAASADEIANFTATATTFASLDAAIDAAITFLEGDATNELAYINWVDGNTYVVVDGLDADGAGTGTNFDAVVKLTGTVSNFSVSNGIVTIA